ncbi:hypothetical protein DUNSADRAFT_8349 [Dunaliella salina]|uniref:Uncharacterized protein n=1 Tax=Dunaliella salina TaxID=3046 RepID=A0ABQ7GJW8_DUNSA|nr:hypothetical protein DUNSADRAFT_8349 [Dunaliella salina]|eukprot:KAF5834848.1 hypothetical protein DUNSADRAFT_8349 [Dunaliella salina]
MATLGADPSSNPWQDLTECLSSRMAELRRYTHMRVEERSKHNFDHELQGLESSIRAVEQSVRELKAHLVSESATIPKVEAVIAASSLQGDDLNTINSHLPPHLPGLQHGSISSTSGHSTGTVLNRRDQSSAAEASTSAPAHSMADPAGNASKKERPSTAPRSYITESELNSLSSYMRGRLTLDKVNSALDELASCAEANHRLMAAAKASNSKLSGADRKRAINLYHNIASKEGIKGRFWFLDNDLKEGASIRPDKTGKAILMMLRHLKRLEEVRCLLDGSSAVVYILC